MFSEPNAERKPEFEMRTRNECIVYGIEYIEYMAWYCRGLNNYQHSGPMCAKCLSTLSLRPSLLVLGEALAVHRQRSHPMGAGNSWLFL